MVIGMKIIELREQVKWREGEERERERERGDKRKERGKNGRRRIKSCFSSS